MILPTSIGSNNPEKVVFAIKHALSSLRRASLRVGIVIKLAVWTTVAYYESLTNTGRSMRILFFRYFFGALRHTRYTYNDARNGANYRSHL